MDNMYHQKGKLVLDDLTKIVEKNGQQPSIDTAYFLAITKDIKEKYKDNYKPFPSIDSLLKYVANSLVMNNCVHTTKVSTARYVAQDFDKTFEEIKTKFSYLDHKNPRIIEFLCVLSDLYVRRKYRLDFDPFSSLNELMLFALNGNSNFPKYANYVDPASQQVNACNTSYRNIDKETFKDALIEEFAMHSNCILEREKANTFYTACRLATIDIGKKYVEDPYPFHSYEEIVEEIISNLNRNAFSDEQKAKMMKEVKIEILAAGVKDAQNGID